MQSKLLQAMLLQYDANRIFLFPAWPIEWAGPGSTVNFSLWAPADTRVSGTPHARRSARQVQRPGKPHPVWAFALWREYLSARYSG